MVHQVGLEPTRIASYAPQAYASAYSATGAVCTYFILRQTLKSIKKDRSPYSVEVISGET